MKILDVVDRNTPPAPWAEGDNIPWNQPAFSARMLREHLSQEHDRASRRSSVVDRHVEWIHEVVLAGRSGRVLDLCCGPGLYTERLAKLGHECRGIDYSPAAIEHARGAAEVGEEVIEYLLGDVRETEFGRGYDLAMMIFGEFNVFRREDASKLLRRAYDALVPGGVLLFEPQTFEAVKGVGETPPAWFTSHAGLFSETPHLCLSESFWDADSGTATVRYFVMDAMSGSVERMAVSYQAYTNAEYAALLAECGFEGGEFLPSLAGTGDGEQVELMAVLARKPRD